MEVLEHRKTEISAPPDEIKKVFDKVFLENGNRSGIKILKKVIYWQFTPTLKKRADLAL